MNGEQTVLRKTLLTVALPLVTLGMAAIPAAASAATTTPRIFYHAAHNVADVTCSGCVFYHA